MILTTRAASKKEQLEGLPRGRGPKRKAAGGVQTYIDALKPAKRPRHEVRPPSDRRAAAQAAILGRKAAPLAVKEARSSKKPRQGFRSHNNGRQAALDAVPGKHTQIKEPTSKDSPDEAFRKLALTQFEALKVRKKGSARAQDKDDILPFLRAISPPQNIAISKNGKKSEVYVISTKQAGQLFGSNTELSVPVFITDGAKSVFDEKSKTRPMEQVLNNWFLSSSEQHTVSDSSRPIADLAPQRSISEIRDHFLAENGYVDYPWNAPDVLSPCNRPGLPDHFYSLDCNLLGDIARSALDVLLGGVCPNDCPDRGDTSEFCGKNSHELTIAEYIEVQRWKAAWDGVVMVADAGAVTFAHWDIFSLGTWISCYEGEIGFAWLRDPTDAQREASRASPRTCIDGRWLYKVLRPGESLYMPPGIIHVVFRLPRGSQTLCLSGQMLQRLTDIDVWLRLMLVEVQCNTKYLQELVLGEYLMVMPVLVRTVRRILDESTSGEQEVERLGGIERVSRAKMTLQALDIATQKMLVVAKKNA